MVRLRYLTPSILAVCVVSIIPFVSAYDFTESDFTIPNWIKNNAGWWADDQIDDSSFVIGLQWLISNDIITLPTTEQGVGDGENVIPSWVKNSAGWWADDEIHDVTFVAAIRYLIGEGIIIIEQEVEEVIGQVEEAEETSGCTFKGLPVPCPDVKEIAEISDFQMKVNSNDCFYCVAWGYVGEKFHIQIETFDEIGMRHIDGVTITAKIVSKDGELRHNFGTVTTEEGIYNGHIIIPSMDWYAENILSVTGEYDGVEKIIEKEFNVFRGKSGGGGITVSGASDCANVPPVSVKDDHPRPQAIAFSPNGLKMFVTSNTDSGDSIDHYDLTGPYCIATGTFVNGTTIETEEATPTGMAFSPDGKRMFIAGKHGDEVNQYNMDVPFTPSDATHVFAFAISDDQEDNPEGIAFNTQGTKMYITGASGDRVNEYDLVTPFEVSSASFAFSLDVSSQEAKPTDITFNNQGTKMFIVGSGGKEVNEYKLATPFVISSASHEYAFSVSAQETNPRGIAFDGSGKKMFIIGFAGKDVNVYQLTTPFTVSSATFVS
uniref:Uncharacterized protein n=1 Tax=uncultured marine thaumarchaeote AD1000_44_E12 TaxID=1455918 RepID=A0A075FSF6_9ARCH|nr:hypothetical protein [uncultured marine thaumarchaeote AD1000_44_E12]